MKLFCYLLISISFLRIDAQGLEFNWDKTIKINPLPLIASTWNIGYEQKIAKKQSIQLGVFHSVFSLSEEHYNGFGITTEYRYYVSRQKLIYNGFYFSPFVRFVHFRIRTDSAEHTSYSTAGCGMTMGLEKTFAGGFIINGFIGPSYNFKLFNSELGHYDYALKPAFADVGIRIGLMIGFAF